MGVAVPPVRQILIRRGCVAMVRRADVAAGAGDPVGNPSEHWGVAKW